MPIVLFLLVVGLVALVFLENTRQVGSGERFDVTKRSDQITWLKLVGLIVALILFLGFLMSLR